MTKNVQCITKNVQYWGKNVVSVTGSPSNCPTGQAGVLPRLNFPKGTLFNRVKRSGLGFMERWLGIAVEWNNLDGLVKSPTSALRCIS